jgi:hypothetical protein
MSDSCSTHSNRTSTGACVRCGRKTCPLCVVDVDSTLYCSILCFTEQTLASKGKTLRQKRHDPLASALEEPSVVLGAADAQPSEDSSVMMAAAAAEDRSETSILDMGETKLRREDASDPEKEDSSLVPMDALKKDPTSILGMGAIARSSSDDTPRSETPLPMVMPGTRRSTMRSACVFHADTPAVVKCSKCGDPICTLCIADEDQGGRCSPACRRDVRRAKRHRMVLMAGGIAASVVLAWVVFRPAPAKPKPPGPTAAEIELAREAAVKDAERLHLEAKAREEARLRVEAREKEEEAIRSAAAARAKAEAEEKARVEAAAKAAADAKAAVATAEADAKSALAKAEAEAKAKADALASAEALAKAEADAKAEAARAAEAAKKAKAEAEAKAKAEAELRAKLAAESKAREEARAKSEAEAKAAAERKAKEEAATRAALTKASSLIREATPLFCALADQAEDADEAPVVIARIDAVLPKLSDARAEYVGIALEGPARQALDRRIASLDELIATLTHYRARWAADR